MQVEISFSDGLLRAQVAELDMPNYTVTVDDDGVIRQRGPMVFLEVLSGLIEQDGVAGDLEAGRYLIVHDGLYRRL